VNLAAANAGMVRTHSAARRRSREPTYCHLVIVWLSLDFRRFLAVIGERDGRFLPDGVFIGETVK
jgi:hypothetical protein